MEKSTSEYMKQIDDLTKAKGLSDDEKTRSKLLFLIVSLHGLCI